jgi:hypothetical protein
MGSVGTSDELADAEVPAQQVSGVQCPFHYPSPSDLGD